jgi:hypothetical protein
MWKESIMIIFKIHLGMFGGTEINHEKLHSKYLNIGPKFVPPGIEPRVLITQKICSLIPNITVPCRDWQVLMKLGTNRNKQKIISGRRILST